MRIDISSEKVMDNSNYRIGGRKCLYEAIEDNNEASEEVIKINDKSKKKIMKCILKPNRAFALIGEKKFLCNGLIALKRNEDWYILNDELSNQHPQSGIIVRSHKHMDDDMVIGIGDKYTIVQPNDYVFTLVVADDRVYFFYKVPKTFETVKSVFYCLDEKHTSKINQMILNIAYLLDENILIKAAALLIPTEEKVGGFSVI